MKQTYGYDDVRHVWWTNYVDIGPGWWMWARGSRRAYRGCRAQGVCRRSAARWVWRARPISTPARVNTETP